MAEGGSIAEFLVGLGFKVDKASMSAALGKVKAFAVGVSAVAVGAAAAVYKIADEYASLGRQAETLRTPIDKLQELNYVAEQVTGSSDAVAKSLEGIVSKNPRIKDAGKALENAGEKMKGMGKAAREAYANRMGIDISLIPALTQDVSGLKDEFAKMYSVSGTNAKEAAEASKGLIAEVNKFKTAAVMMGSAVGLAVMGRIRQAVESLRKSVIENFDKIKAVFEIIIGFALRVVSAFANLANRIIGWIGKLVSWFSNLDRSHQIVIASIFGMLAAWRLLNAGFLATSIGMIVGGLAAIVALVDDYLTYMEGGESYFDWGPWEQTINDCVEALKPIIGVIKGVADGIVAAFGPAVATIKTAISGLWEHFKLIFKLIGALFSGDLDQIMAIGEAIIDNFIATAIGVFNGLVNTISTFFSAMWPSVQANFPDFAAWAESAGNSITSFFGTAIKWVEDKLAFLTSWMPDWLKDDLGIKEVKITADPAAASIAPVPGSNGLNRNVPAGAALTPSPFQAAAIDGGAQARPVENKIDMKQETIINVQSNGDPQAVGAAVASRQGDVNGQLVRTTKGAVR